MCNIVGAYKPTANVSYVCVYVLENRKQTEKRNKPKNDAELFDSPAVLISAFYFAVSFVVPVGWKFLFLV